MQVSLLSLCPKSWKVLFLLKENEISFEFKTLPLNEKKALKIGTYDSFLSYLLDNIDILIPKELRKESGKFIDEIENDLCNNLVMKIRNERIINPLVKRIPPNTNKLQGYRTNLKKSLKNYSKIVGKNTWLLKEGFSIADIYLSTCIAVLDYLGEVSWKDNEIKDLYDWYLKIKCKSSFEPILRQRCEGVPPHKNFINLDF